MLVGKYRETLNYTKWESVYGDFHLYYRDSFVYNHQVILECSAFLEGLWRGNVPFILRGVHYSYPKSEKWYDSLYFAPLEDWNEAHDCYSDLYVFNSCGYQLLQSEITNFDWLLDIDYHDLHKDLNFYVGQMTCGLVCIENGQTEHREH